MHPLSSQSLPLSVCRSVCLLFSALCQARKEEEPVQNSCWSVKEGCRWTGTQRCRVEGTDWQNLGPHCPPPNTFTYTPTIRDKCRENGRTCQRIGWLTFVGGTLGEGVAEGTLGGLSKVKGRLMRGQLPVLSEPAFHPQAISLPCLFFVSSSSPPASGQEKEGTS